MEGTGGRKGEKQISGIFENDLLFEGLRRTLKQQFYKDYRWANKEADETIC